MLAGDALPNAKSTTLRVTACVFGAGAPALFALSVSVYFPAGVPLVVFTVTVTLTGLFFVGFTLDEGEKLQVTPVAGASQLKSTAPLNDPKAPTCTVNCPLPPGKSVTEVGEGAPRVKSTTLTVKGVV